MTAPAARPVHVRHLVASLAGVTLPLAAAFVAIPILIAQLGLPHFGVLTLLMAGFAYLQVLDCGLGTALTYSLSRSTSADNTVAHAAVPAMGFVLVIGSVVAAAIFFLAPFIAAWSAAGDSVDADQVEAGLRWVGLAVPGLLLGSVLTGVMAAAGRFGAINAARVVFGGLTYLGAALATVVQPTLDSACFTIVIVRTAWTALHIWQCRDLLALRGTCTRAFDWRRLKPFVRFGGWLSVSNVVGPFMVYLDRFYIGAILSAEHVARYVTPYEVATKISLVPAAVLPVLFPAFVRETHSQSPERSATPMFMRASVLVAWVCGLGAIALALLARPLLDFLSRGQFGDESVLVLCVLLAGVVVNSVAQIFFARVQSSGRTDLLAKLHCWELVFYAAGLWWLTQEYGILGAATAWSIRVIVDAAVLCWLSCVETPLAKIGCWSAFGLTLITGIAIVSAHGLAGPAAQAAVLAVPAVLSFLLARRFAFRRDVVSGGGREQAAGTESG